MTPIQHKLHPIQRKFLEKYLEYYVSNAHPDFHQDTLNRILLEDCYYEQQRPVLNELREKGLVEMKQRYDKTMEELAKVFQTARI